MHACAVTRGLDLAETQVEQVCAVAATAIDGTEAGRCIVVRSDDELAQRFAERHAEMPDELQPIGVVQRVEPPLRTGHERQQRHVVVGTAGRAGERQMRLVFVHAIEEGRTSGVRRQDR
ncbi:hypothetical protein [Lysobacter brunescens]|uniref:Uncharacterized protein n=1 Tax=Lysobacter brunescens TaxID=262323 RepID=A0ABW2YCQ1_9GAMM